MTALAWVRPTRRAMRWRPLLSSSAGVAVLVLTLRAAGASGLSGSPEMIAIAVVVAAAVLALDDPAHALVAATPARFARRVLHRLAWLVPATFLLLATIGWSAVRLDVAAISGPVLGRAAALGALAVATHLVVARRRPDIAASAATVAPALAVTFAVSTRRDMVGGTLSHVWLDHPWPVALSAVAIGALAAQRR